MPIYEYKCKNCKSNFEKMQKITDDPLRVCESCGGELEKQISRTGFQFKGSGWYVTDYSNKGKAESKAESKGETKGETSGAGEKSSTNESTKAPQSASNSTKSDGSSTKKE